MGWLPEQPSNGLDRVFHALAQHLPGVGVNVRGLVVGTSSVASASNHQIEAVAHHEASLLKRLRSFRRHILRHLKSNDYDAVATHFALYAAPALDQLNNQPLIVHFHGPWASESSTEGESSWKAWLKTAIERAVYRRGDRFIVLSRAFREELVRRFDVAERLVRIVPGGVDTERFAPKGSRESAREQLGWPTDRPIMLSVRRLIRRVGLENLVSAMEKVRRQIPEALLLLAGKGPLRDALEAQIHQSDLKHHVQLLGYLPESDLPLAYRAANFSVVPTLSLEGFGLIAVESLAAGTPVLVTRVGGLPEIVEDLSENLLFPDPHPTTLADHLIAALIGELPLPSSHDCQEYARQHYDWRSIASQTREVYEEVV